jgi:short-subunit dehydrogenase
MQIAGSSVLLTGATGGLGQAIARALRARGAELLLTGRRGEVLESLSDELGARTLAVDLSEPADVERLAKDAGAVDILIANAGLPGSGRLDSYEVAEIDRALDVNLRAPIVLARALLPAMVQRGGGHLLFMSSLSGKVANAGGSIYSATKFGLRGFSSALRAELHCTGVGVSCVFPGFIRDAGMFAEAGVKLPPGVGTRTPEDVAKAVIGAIEHDRGEVDVAPLTLRAGVMFGSVLPDIAASVSRKSGGERLASEYASSQRAMR